MPVESRNSSDTLRSGAPEASVTRPVTRPPGARAKSMPVVVFGVVTLIGVPVVPLHELPGQGTSS